jgi:hypothetical protein
VISAEEAEQELDVCKALAELVVIATEIGEVPTSPEEKMRLEEKVLSRCGRAGVSVAEMPRDIIQAVTSVAGRIAS